MLSTFVFILNVLVFNIRVIFVNSEQVCLSDQCRKLSLVIQKNLNTTVDPCVDMYQFACGGWIQNNDFPEGVGRWTVITKLKGKIEKQLVELLEEDGWIYKGINSSAVRKIKQFYQSCLDVQRIQDKGAEPLKKLIDEFGSWTVTLTNKRWDKSSWSLQEALQRTHNLTGTSFWTITIYNDAKNASRNILHISQGGLTMTDQAHEYSRPGFRKRYMKTALTFGKLMGRSKNEVRAKMSEVFKLEKKLAKIFTPLTELRDPKKAYNLKNLTEFQSMIGSWINVVKYFGALLGEVTPDFEIVVKTPDYFSKLGKVIISTEKKVLANYIMWNFIIPALGYLPEKFADLLSINPFGEIKGLDSRKITCLEKCKHSMPFVISALYVERHYSQELNVKVIAAVNDIEKEFIDNLNQLSWLDDETKRNLREKAEAMTKIVGYPNWFMVPRELDAKYEDLLTEEGEFFQNFLHSRKFQSNNWKNILRQPAEENNVNAYYNFNVNRVAVMAGMLQEPIFSNNFPKSYFYGALGAVLGHEITHAFDSRGRLFDKDGILKDHWTPRVAEEFNRRAQCFVDQYNKYEAYGHNISGLLTLGENIADNGGVKMAYRAYKSSTGAGDFTLRGLNLTDDQLFFVGFSSVLCSKYTAERAISYMQTSKHSLGEFRVIGTVSNSREFSQAFNCSMESPMNPKNKCEIW